MIPVEICVVEVLRRGLDDWIQAAEVASVAKLTGGQSTNSDIEELALSIIQDLVDRGLMKPGDLTKDGFIEWDLKPSEAVQRIRQSWRSLGRLPGLGEICWLSNTVEGDRKAREFVASNTSNGGDA